MPKLTIDGVVVEVPAGTALIQACEQAGREVPRFCYHERLSIAGNCRMCLVEVEKAPKPVASCGYPIAEGMVVHTDSPMVRAARRGVMEFLLINHPLDCPICDQGGECDLQDQAMGYGRGGSRYLENKRAVKDKYLGPIVKTIMTRCIQCTRCIRFATEIAGVPELGATSRGENMEVTTYVERALSSELSGNLVDICPVGALTSKPYAYVARSWELRHTDSIDVLDAVGSNIRVDARGPEVLRVLPRTNEEINEEWLADKSRHAIDGLKRRRLDACWVRRDGRLARASWDEAFAAIATRLAGVPGERIGGLVGNLADAESMVVLRDVLASLGSTHVECRQDGARYDIGRRDFYTFNTTIAGIEEADALLLVGTDPRREAPILNARIRKRWLAGGLPVALIGEAAELTYDYAHLGAAPSALGGLGAFDAALSKAQRPMLVLGQAALARPDGGAVLAAAWRLTAERGMLRDDWHGFNVLHTAASRVAALDLGLLSERPLETMDVLWLLGADEFDGARIGREAFVVYQGHHGDRGAARADVILPGAAYTEKNGTYVNTEGRVQRGRMSVHPPGEAREDWRILRAFADVLRKPLPYDTIEQVRSRLEQANSSFARVGAAPRFGCADRSGPAAAGALQAERPFGAWFASYYQTDPISRASPTMAACVAEIAPLPLAAE